jgi:cell division protein FtsI (penicillin-binding protein 3)
MVLVLGILGTRAAFLGTVRADDLSARADDQRRVDRELPAPRGNIITRDGNELASTQPALFVTADPSEIDDPTAAAKALAPVLGRPAQDIYKQIMRPSRYEVLHRALSTELRAKLEALNIAGVRVEDTDQRYYPLRRTGSQVVGFMGERRDGTVGGTAGLELQYDKALTGRPGRRVELRDAFSEPLRVVENQPAVPGMDVHVTIDSSIQDYTETVIARVRAESGAKAVSAIVMRPSDGAIYAMASVPRFDPNNRVDLPIDAIGNRPVVDVFEPGSTFKIIPITGAIEEGVVTPQTVFDLPLSVTLKFDGEETTLKDAHDRPAKSASVAQILKESSNIGTYKIADRLSKEKNALETWIKRFGVTEPTGIDFPGEVKGLYKPKEEWSGVSILNIPIGQGISTTLTQMARAFGAVANGGRLETPHFASKVGGEKVDYPPGKRIMSEATAHTMTQMLKDVVSDGGTGVKAEIPGYDVAGKTGTSNKIAPDGTYDKDRYWSSFIGFLPANNPRLLVAVLVDEPGGGNIYGGDVAAPAFERVAKFAINRLSISP